jgi:hypothetical protein
LRERWAAVETVADLILQRRGLTYQEAAAVLQDLDMRVPRHEWWHQPNAMLYTVLGYQEEFCLAAAALPLFCSAAIGAQSYCDDPNAGAEWSAMADKYAGSHDRQRLHALWLGLCQKVREGSIEHNRAVDLFETERRETMWRMECRLRTPGAPFG